MGVRGRVMTAGVMTGAAGRRHILLGRRSRFVLDSAWIRRRITNRDAWEMTGACSCCRLLFWIPGGGLSWLVLMLRVPAMTA